MNIATTSQTITWAERVHEAIVSQQSILCVGLDPIYEKMPAQHKTGDVAGDMFAYNKSIIDGAAPFAAAFKPQYKCYSAEGEAGITALRRTCTYIKETYPHIPVILDAKYADIGHVLERCAVEAFDMLGVDAVTAMPAPGKQALAPLISRRSKGCFLVVRTSNPGADELQDIETAGGEPLYIAITRKIAEGWDDTGSVGLVAPATDPRVLAAVRQAAPYLPILCPGVGAQGGDLNEAVAAGLDPNGAGLLINVSRAIMEAPDPGKAAREWRDALEAARISSLDRVEGAKQQAYQSALEEVVIGMFNIGAIQFKPVTLKSGLVSPYYNNLRLLSSYPELLRKVARLMACTMEEAGVKPDIVIGIALAGIPLGVALSQVTGIPGGYVRSEAKAHGTKQMVEGAWSQGATAVLVDDVVSDGASKLDVIGYLQDAGLKVQDIVVLVDRGQGGPALMERHGLRCHAAATMEQVLDVLLKAGLIGDKEVEESKQFMSDARAHNEQE
ncbi:MAG: orotidine-5'-phosphate decarboxylase [Chloroflexota bacterium]